MINKKYYNQFEGEPEIQLICRKEDDSDILIIWEGYFDQIMKLMSPEKHGWTGLAYCYNMYTGWYEESPWLIKDLQQALQQFESIDCRKLSNESFDIWLLICNMFKEAILSDYKVYISRE